MKKTRKALAAMLILALTMAFVPTTVQAATDPGIAMVTISNNTFDGGAWTGDYLSAIVEIAPGMTLGDAVKAACDEAGVSVTGASVAEGSFITDIDGLGSGDAGGWSGWMVTVNNWFNLNGLVDPVEDGDWISVQYSVDGMGGDLGSVFFPVEDANNKKLQELAFDAGSLAPSFTPDVHEYTLTLPAGTESLFVLPMAFNLNYQVRTSVDGTVYKLMNGVPVSEGTVITVVSGDPSWPSMNNGGFGTGAENVPGETYTITIAYDDAVVDDGVDENAEPESAETMDASPDTSDNGPALLAVFICALVGLVVSGVTITRKQRTN